MPCRSEQRLPPSGAPAAAEGASGAQCDRGGSRTTGEHRRFAELRPCPSAAAYSSTGSRPSPQALSVRCSAAASSDTLPQSLQSLVSAFQAVPDPMAVRRRRRRCLP